MWSLHTMEYSGIPGWRSSLAPAFGPGRHPGDPGSNPMSGTQCSTHQVPPSVPVTQSSCHRPPTSLFTTPCSFPRVRSLSCSVSLTDISHSFLKLCLTGSSSMRPLVSTGLQAAALWQTEGPSLHVCGFTGATSPPSSIRSPACLLAPLAL